MDARRGEAAVIPRSVPCAFLSTAQAPSVGKDMGLEGPGLSPGFPLPSPPKQASWGAGVCEAGVLLSFPAACKFPSRSHAQYVYCMEHIY